jgi:hypothetical protein
MLTFRVVISSVIKGLFKIKKCRTDKELKENVWSMASISELLVRFINTTRNYINVANYAFMGTFSGIFKLCAK